MRRFVEPIGRVGKDRLAELGGTPVLRLAGGIVRSGIAAFSGKGDRPAELFGIDRFPAAGTGALPMADWWCRGTNVVQLEIGRRTAAQAGAGHSAEAHGHRARRQRGQVEPQAGPRRTDPDNFVRPTTSPQPLATIRPHRPSSGRRCRGGLFTCLGPGCRSAGRGHRRPGPRAYWASRRRIDGSRDPGRQSMSTVIHSAVASSRLGIPASRPGPSCPNP